MVTGSKIERQAGVGAGPARRPRLLVSAACLSCDIHRRKLGLKMKVILLPRGEGRHCDDEDVEERRTMGVLPRRPTHLSEMEAFLDLARRGSWASINHNAAGIVVRVPF